MSVLMLLALSSCKERHRSSEGSSEDPPACDAGFRLFIEIDATKPNGDAWDLLGGKPDPSGNLTLSDGDSEIFAPREGFKLNAPFFNNKNRRRVRYSLTFDLDLVDLDVETINWKNLRIDGNDHIASFRDVSLASLLEGNSVSDGSATITKAVCLD